MFAIDKSDTNSNFTETSVVAMSNDGTSSQGSGFSYLKSKTGSGTRSNKSNSTLRSGIRSVKFQRPKSSQRSDDGSSTGYVKRVGTNFSSDNLSDMAGLEDEERKSLPDE